MVEWIILSNFMFNDFRRSPVHNACFLKHNNQTMLNTFHLYDIDSRKGLCEVKKYLAVLKKVSLLELKSLEKI